MESQGWENQAGTWRRVVDAAEILEDEPLAVEADGRKIALYRVDGDVHATDNVCTHAYALLSDGLLEGCQIECPLHNARFDVRTGRALSSPAERDLRTYPVRVVDGGVEILLPG
ncbi:non-heme iron oxygenase ferredoxin subunit [Muricoccus aerilatus]|uniref:non-heme iron oxygenase ferredoxin subunit n=1 Tax=Muricoccus aerilatus TaxID=452982 RepID=UPI0005C1AC2F|nr:non-heme iron oxygenase ferredoxin subunit [Roseomonas aerilata]